jgi:competence protein ComEA
MTLPGIGPALSEAILEYRERHGDFKTVADLDRVPGIGPAKLEALAGQVIIGSVLTHEPSIPSASPLEEEMPDTNSDAMNPPEGNANAGSSSSLPEESARNESDPALALLNEMREEDLVSIPGIGPALAGQILSSRESLGGFVTWEQVGSVPGIGPKRLENLREKVRIP